MTCHPNLRYFFLISLLVGAASIAFGDENVVQTGSVDAGGGVPHSFNELPMAGRNYWSLGLHNSLPSLETAERFDRAYNHFGFSYSRVTPAHWWLGIGLEYHPLRLKETHEIVVLWVVKQRIEQIVRIYHPFYLQIGGGLLYFYPADSTKFPPTPSGQLHPEMGFSVGWGIIYRVNDRLLVSTSVSRWRGVNSMQIHGLSLLLGFHFGLERAI